MKNRKIIIGLSVIVFALLFVCGCGKTPIDPNNCLHTTHNAETGRCVECNKKVGHYYKNYKCTGCDKTTEFIWDGLKYNEAIWNPIKKGGSDKKGTIDELKYNTTAYNIKALTGEEKTIEQTAYVYLPYGYDSSEKYDVIILVHGAGDNEGYWLAQGDYKPTDTMFVGTGNYTKEMLDYVFANNICKPAIVVTPTFYNLAHDKGNELAGKEGSVASKQFGHELVDFLLPKVIETYSTYAEGTADEQMKAARDHFAYAGLSYGGYTSINSIMSYCLPYFSWLATYSFSFEANEIFEKAKTEMVSYPLHYWYYSCGTEDTFYNDSTKMYKNALATVSAFKDEENCRFVEGYGANHTYEFWLTSLYNTLHKFFKD